MGRGRPVVAPESVFSDANETFCVGKRPRVPPRLLAAGLLAGLAGRFAWYAAHVSDPFAPAPGMAAMLVLGGCLWWVAHRQAGTGGAVVALSLLAGLPLGMVRAGAVAAPGLFAMLYTAVGVAHALQGPQRKWAPRIGLMAGLCGFTAAAAPMACGVGLVLALAGMLYLAEGRRRLLPGLFALWAVAAGLGLGVRAGLHALGLHGGAAAVAVGWRGLAGVELAGIAALGLWVVARRSRYFGNTAPLLAAGVILLAGVVAGPECLAWALPFALVFIAGMFADALEGGSKWVWVAVAFGAFWLQVFGAGLTA
jgi:hypothetical protein